MPIARSQDWEAMLLGLVRKQCYFLCTGLNAVTQLSAWTRCAEFINPASETTIWLHIQAWGFRCSRRQCYHSALQTVHAAELPQSPTAGDRAPWCWATLHVWEWNGVTTRRCPRASLGTAQLASHTQFLVFSPHLSGVLDFLSGWFLCLVPNINNFPCHGPRFFLTPVTVGNSFFFHFVSAFSSPHCRQKLAKGL